MRRIRFAGCKERGLQARPGGFYASLLKRCLSRRFFQKSDFFLAFQAAVPVFCLFEAKIQSNQFIESPVDEFNP